jgi:hypothetical protein
MISKGHNINTSGQQLVLNGAGDSPASGRIFPICNHEIYREVTNHNWQVLGHCSSARLTDNVSQKEYSQNIGIRTIDIGSVYQLNPAVG